MSELRKAAEEALFWMDGARTHLTIKERMHPDGLRLYDSARGALRAALSAPDDAEPAATEERERCKKACEAVAEQVTYQRDSQGAVEKCIAAIDALGVAP